MISGGGNTSLGGNAMILNASTIVFSPDGKFHIKKIKSGTNSEAELNTIAFSDQALGGTYFINNYEIELIFNNGKTAKQLFYFYPNKKDYFGIGTAVYSPVK